MEEEDDNRVLFVDPTVDVDTTTLFLVVGVEAVTGTVVTIGSDPEGV